jgi:phosphatidylglycerophosphatase A
LPGGKIKVVSIKESSDDLNPAISEPELVAGGVKSQRGPVDYLAMVVATFGVGFLPLAPGTWGSLVGVVIYLVVRWFSLSLPRRTGSQGLLLLNPQIGFIALELVIILLVSLLGIWAASRTERLLGRKDPGKVVVDEVAGQMIALLPLPLFGLVSWRLWVIVSFILFRFFDILKPYPARRLEDLHGGLGIMADDLVAGAYAAVLTALLLALFAIFFF